MREVAFFQFSQAKGGGHLGQGKGQEIVRVDKFDATDFQA
jgi:hypothetical protein